MAAEGKTFEWREMSGILSRKRRVLAGGWWLPWECGSGWLEWVQRDETGTLLCREGKERRKEALPLHCMRMLLWVGFGDDVY